MTNFFLGSPSLSGTKNPEQALQSKPAPPFSFPFPFLPAPVMTTVPTY